MDRLLLDGFGSLVTGVDFLPGLLQNALHIIGIGAGRGQLQIHLKSIDTFLRQNDPLRLGVDGSLSCKPLAFEVVENRLSR